MADDFDICRSANLLIQHHGTMAEECAQARLQAMQARDDPNGEATWRRMMQAIKDLRRVARKTIVVTAVISRFPP